MLFLAQSEQKLRENGYKITDARQDVIEVLNTASRPLSAYEIKDLLACKGEKYQVITIYRVLDLLLELDLVHKIYSIGSYIKCSSLHKHQHKYLVCSKCHSIQALDYKKSQTLPVEFKNFVPMMEINEVLGLCAVCN